MKKVVLKTLGFYLNTLAAIAPRLAARQSVNLFCYPFRSRMKPYHNDFLNSSDKFDFKFNGSRIQGYRWGRGPRKVLFVHGWQSHTFRWRQYVAMLPGEEFTIYAFDAPGHGYSSGKFLSVPLYSQLIEQFIAGHGRMEAIVGHSIGSFSTLYTFHRVPLLPVDRVVLMAPPGEARDFINFFARQLGLSARVIAISLAHFENVFHYPVSYFSTARFARSMNVPGMIIHDAEDDETPFRYARDIHEAWKKSDLVRTNGLGHNLRSPEVMQLVTDYIINSFHPNQAQGPEARVGNSGMTVVLRQ